MAAADPEHDAANRSAFCESYRSGLTAIRELETHGALSERDRNNAEAIRQGVAASGAVSIQ
jgi:hypothetical protein